jgi:MTH538 TIR-like domain (DUF1863)
MMVRKVFISHAFDHTELYNSIRNRLDRENFNWRDCSVPRNRRYLADDTPLPDDEMKRLLAPNIDECDVVVVIAKPIVGRRLWLRWELEYAQAAGKPILAVWRRQVDKRVSKYARDKADKCVDTWNIRSIMNAIDELKARPLAAAPAVLAVAIDSIPDVSPQPVVEEVIVPAAIESPEPLAPQEELALTAGETVVPEVPKDALGPTLTAGPSPDAVRTPIASIALPDSPFQPSEPPKQVIAATFAKRKWWQFWRPKPGDGTRLN